MSRYDLAVVGGGVVGLLSAWRALEAGLSVIVLDAAAGHPQASWAGAGILMPLYPWHYPADLVALCQRGRTLYPGIVSELQQHTGIDCGFRSNGILLLDPPAGRQANGDWAKGDFTYELLPGESLHDIETTLQWESGRQIARFPAGAQIRNPRLLQSLRLRIEQLGGRFLSAEVTRVEDDAKQVTGLSLQGGEEIKAANVLIAAGAWSSGLLPQESAWQGSRPVRGQMLLYRVPELSLQQVVIASGKYLVPRGDGYLLVGSSTEHAGFECKTTDAVAAELQAFAVSLLPELADLSPLQRWAGLRPAFENHCPITAKSERLAGLYLNSGHYRVGLTAAPAAAETFLSLIINKLSTD